MNKIRYVIQPGLITVLLLVAACAPAKPARPAFNSSAAPTLSPDYACPRDYYVKTWWLEQDDKTPVQFQSAANIVKDTLRQANIGTNVLTRISVPQLDHVVFYFWGEGVVHDGCDVVANAPCGEIEVDTIQLQVISSTITRFLGCGP